MRGAEHLGLKQKNKQQSNPRPQNNQKPKKEFMFTKTTKSLAPVIHHTLSPVSPPEKKEINISKSLQAGLQSPREGGVRIETQKSSDRAKPEGLRKRVAGCGQPVRDASWAPKIEATSRPGDRTRVERRVDRTGTGPGSSRYGRRALRRHDLEHRHPVRLADEGCAQAEGDLGPPTPTCRRLSDQGRLKA